MTSIHRIAIFGRSLFAGRVRVLAAGAVVFCAAHLAGPMPAQTQWQTCPSGFGYCTNPAGTKVGLGAIPITGQPSDLLTLFNGNLVMIGGVAMVQTGGAPSPSYGFAGNANSGMFSPSGQHLAFSVGGLEWLRITTSGNVGIGSQNPDTKLTVNGAIKTKEVIVTNTIPADYVFKPGYRLRPLNEVAAYIKQHRHLPEIPSEAEVREKGVGLGAMQAKLLAKIEELTLHMIQAEERNNRLERQNRDLQERMERLEAGAANGGR